MNLQSTTFSRPNSRSRKCSWLKVVCALENDLCRVTRFSDSTVLKIRLKMRLSSFSNKPSIFLPVRGYKNAGRWSNATISELLIV